DGALFEDHVGGFAIRAGELVGLGHGLDLLEDASLTSPRPRCRRAQKSVLMGRIPLGPNGPQSGRGRIGGLRPAHYMPASGPGQPAFYGSGESAWGAWMSSSGLCL